jgi:quercetin dioxygenase-like cupin family protein
LTRAWDELIAEHVLGTLPESEQAEAEAVVSESPEAHQEVAQLRAALDRWAEDLPAKTPPPEGKRRLLTALDGPERFHPFLGVLQQRFDLDEAALLPLLAKLDDAGVWLNPPFPDVTYFNFTPGPATGAAEGGFVRVRANGRFPPHRHTERELAVVLQGTLLEADRVGYPGDIVEMKAGSTHAFGAGPGRDLILMVVHSGISFDVI